MEGGGNPGLGAQRMEKSIMDIAQSTKKKKSSENADFLTTDQTVEEVFATILRSNFATLVTWEPVARQGEDIEGVHQMRVVLRRMRSAFNIFRKAIPHSITGPISEEMRWAANTFGPARDRDVFIAETLQPMVDLIPLPEGEQAMAALAQRYRDEAYTQVRGLLSSDRYREFKGSFGRWIAERGWRDGEWGDVSPKGLESNIVPFATRALSGRMTQTLARGVRIAEMSETERHMLRIDCKKLRYATEFFNPLFDRRQMESFSLALKDLQGLLGIQNDVAVLPTLLEELLTLDSSKPVVQYAGAMVGWRAHQAQGVETQLLAKWLVFARSVQPWDRKPLRRSNRKK